MGQALPFPKEETTPPVIKINLVMQTCENKDEFLDIIRQSKQMKAPR